MEKGNYREKANRCCPICGNNIKNKVLWESKEILPEQIMLPEEITVVSCGNCGMCYSDTPATVEQYDEYYGNNNIYGSRSLKLAPELDRELMLLAGNMFEKSDMILDMGSGGGIGCMR